MKHFDYSNPYYADPRNKLIGAVGNGDIETVRALLAAGLRPDQDFEAEEFKCAPLFFACTGGHFEIAKELRIAGADVNRYQPDRYPFTYLAVAAQGGHRDVVEWLVDEGADPNIVCTGDSTAADMAAAHGHGQIALFLYGLSGRNLSAGEELVFASQSGDLEAVKRLVNEGAEIDSSSVGGFNAFMWACMSGREPIVRFMLEHGVSPYTRGEIDQIPAMAWASMKGHRTVMDTLYEFDQAQDKVFPARNDIPDLASMMKDAIRSATGKSKRIKPKSKGDA